MSETWAWHQIMFHDAEQITFKPRGHSMEPLIMNKQEVTIRRLGDDDVLAVGDIVLAQVHGYIYLHKVTAVDGDRIQIGNNHGHINGWTHRDKIVGRLDG